MQHAQEQDHISDIKRVNRGYKLREDLIISLKHRALVEKRKLYEVMETAMEEYLDRHSQEESHENIRIL